MTRHGRVGRKRVGRKDGFAIMNQSGSVSTKFGPPKIHKFQLRTRTVKKILYAIYFPKIRV